MNRDESKTAMRVTCETTTAQLLEYVEGTITPALRDQFATHFRDCLPCQRLLESYRRTAALCREALQGSVPPAFHDRLLTYLRRHCKPGT